MLPCLIIESKDGAYPIRAHSLGRLIGLTVDNRQGTQLDAKDKRKISFCQIVNAEQKVS
jgi:hypothetical protein